MLSSRAGEEIVDAETLAPCASRRSHRCEPRKPAPPVTRIRDCRCIRIDIL